MKARSAIEMLDSKDYKKTELYEYQWLIGKLIYLVCRTRPDITFAVRQLSKYNANLRKSHFQTAKRVVQYLKSTIKMGLMFRCTTIDPLFYSLTDYVDNNFAKNPKDWK